MSRIRRASAVLVALGVVAMVLAIWNASGAEGAGPGLTPRAFAPAIAADDSAAPTLQPSATPTATLTATVQLPTATPTAAPTATPVPPASGVTAQQGVMWKSSIGSLHVPGMVKNGLGVPIGFVKVTARFYSAGGVLLATDFTYANVDVIAPGSDSPFEVLLLTPPPGIASADVAVTDYSTSSFIGPVVTGLSFTVSNKYVSIIGTLHIVGTVTNQSGKKYDYVEVIAAIFDPAGRVLRVEDTFTEPSSLANGQTGTFDLLVLDGGSLLGNTTLYWIGGHPK